MEEDIEALQNRLIEELSGSVYPSERSTIRDRYADTSYYIFKSSQTGYRGSFLSFGSRRSSVVSNYGNTPTVMRRSFSSNGMLEYGYEQSSSKWKDVHALPSITKEEREIELEEEECSSQNRRPLSSGEQENTRKGFKNASYDRIDALSPLEEEEDSESNYKNRKIFEHYDMPPIRKLSLTSTKESAHADDLSASSVDRKATIHEDELNQVESSNINLKSQLHIKDDNLKSFNSKSPSNSNSKSDLRKILSGSSPASLQEKLPSLPNESSTSKDTIKTFTTTLTVTAEPCSLEKSESFNKKKEFPRKSSARLSLRDLPLRSPTPPKKSQRKTTKNNTKDKENTTSSLDEGKEHLPEVPSVPLSEESTSLGEKNTIDSLPPLISSEGQSNENCIRQIQPVTLPLCASNYSTQILDNTPLFIVEEEEASEKSVISPRIGIQNLASDSKLNKSFIVVHPTSDSNSLGLAPISKHKKKSSDLSSSSSLTHSSSTMSVSQRLLNGKKNSFSQSNRSLNKTKLKKLSDGSSSSTSYLPTTAIDSTQVRLLKFSQSVDESSNVPPSSSVSSSSSCLTNFLVTKGQINSFPYESNLQTDQLNLDFSGNFVNTNSSRLCIVM